MDTVQPKDTANPDTTHTLRSMADDVTYFADQSDSESGSDTSCMHHQTLTMYKRVDKKVHPVSTHFPDDCYIRREISDNPLDTLPPLPFRPPEFQPTAKISHDRMKILNINPNKNLWPEEEKLFKHIMVLNEGGIAFEDIERGTLKDHYFSPYIIPTVDHKPWEDRNIPIPRGLEEKVMEALKLKIDAGVYEQSQSSYRSKWFVVLKKTGKLRIVHDLQPLNRITVRDAGTLPILDDFVEGFAGYQCYTVFDLFWGFDARKIHPKSRELTAFQTPLGLLQITSLPTGFTNSPAEFQKCMAIVLKDEIPHTANIFIDDLPIKGPRTMYLDTHGKPEVMKENPGIRRAIWEHAQDVHRIMHRVHHAGATFAAAKAQICQSEVMIVGQRCNSLGREPDTAKIDKILSWPAPKSRTEVRQFLGLCGTVRIWVPAYSTLVRPMVQLTRKNVDFEWTSEAEEAFQTMKEYITKAPALRPIDYKSKLPVILSVDSSMQAVGMILSQIDEEGVRRPARYGSLPMSERESRYSQAKLELFGLYRALRHWRLYLVGAENLVIEVDAKSLKDMLNHPDLVPQAAMNRWIHGILLFDFKLVHVPAEKHQGPDALSRRPLAEGEKAESDDDAWLDNLTLLGYQPQWRYQTKPAMSQSQTKIESAPFCLANQQAEEDILRNIKKFLTTMEIPRFPTLQHKQRFILKVKKFFVQEGLLYRRNGSNPPRRVIEDEATKQSILRQAHEDLGHKGTLAVYDLVSLRFYWPRLRADVHYHVRSCHECQIRNVKRVEYPLSVSLPTTLFGKIYLDIMRMPEIGGFKYIVAARDDLSGTCEARALKRATAKDMTKFFMDQIYHRYGAPQVIITDNGPEMKESFQRKLERLGIPQIPITPYNHHANGVVERGHFTLREAIIKACEGNIARWPDLVQAAVFADRITVSRITGFSPYYLLHGVHPLLPMDLTESTFLVTGFHPDMDTSTLLALRMRQLAKLPADVAAASETLRQARYKSKEDFERRYHKKLTQQVYQPGDFVLVRNTAVEMSHDRKHQPRYLGPYVVAQQVSKNAYRLQEMDGAEWNQRIVSWRLIPYISRTHPLMKNPASEESDSGDEQEVVLTEETN